MTATLTRSSVDSLVEFLGECRPGALPVTFTARTKVKLLQRHRETKEPCPFGEVWKVARVNAMLQCNYGSAMERRSGEAPYEYGETWHEPVRDTKGKLTPCSRDPKTDRYYLRVQDPVALEARYGKRIGRRVVPISLDDLRPYLSEGRKYGQGELVRFERTVYRIDEVCPEGELILANNDVHGIVIQSHLVDPVVGFKVYGLEGVESITIDGRTWSKPAFTFESPEEV